MEQVKGKKEKKEVGEGIEELLIRLRNEKGWSRVELMSHLSNKTIKEKDIRKWELGLEYPDLDIIYKLSEIYLALNGSPGIKTVEAKSSFLAEICGVGKFDINKRPISN